MKVPFHPKQIAEAMYLDVDCIQSIYTKPFSKLDTNRVNTSSVLKVRIKYLKGFLLQPFHQCEF
jgi:hypothetical protein